MFIDKMKVGDIVNGNGQIGVIQDILYSHQTGNYIICVSFVHNIGNARTYDMLEVKDGVGTLWGIPEWELVGLDKLKQAIEKRKNYLNQALNKIAKDGE